MRYLKDAGSFQVNLVKPNAAGKGMIVSSVTENGTNLQFQQDADAVTVSTTAIAGSEHTYSITYQGIPVDGLIISTNKFGHRTFLVITGPTAPTTGCPAWMNRPTKLPLIL